MFFMLNSTEHAISTAHKTKIPTNNEVSCFRYLRCFIYHAHKYENANILEHFFLEYSDLLGSERQN